MTEYEKAELRRLFDILDNEALHDEYARGEAWDIVRSLLGLPKPPPDFRGRD